MTRPALPPRPPVLPSLLLLLAAACTPDFESVETVKDLRILAIRADPPEVLLETNPTTWPPIRVDALVVDPSQKAGWKADWELWGCGSSTSGSAQSNTQSQVACCPQDGACQEATGRFKLATGSTTPDKIGASVFLSKDLFTAAMKADPMFGLGGVPVVVELRLRKAGSSDPWTRGLKRLVYGIYDELDLTCLPPINAEALQQCISQNRCEQFLNVCIRDNTCAPCSGIPKKDMETGRPKLPNKNPVINWVKVSKAKKIADDKPVVPTTWTVLADDPQGKSVWQVQGGEEYFLLPKPDPHPGADKEIYVVGSRIPSYDQATQTFKYTQVKEEHLTYHFYSTDGALAHPTTGGRPSRFFENKKATEISTTFKPPLLDGPTDPTEKDLRLWVVVRDDRGGVGWITLSARGKRVVKDGGVEAGAAKDAGVGQEGGGG